MVPANRSGVATCGIGTINDNDLRRHELATARSMCTISPTSWRTDADEDGYQGRRSALPSTSDVDEHGRFVLHVDDHRAILPSAGCPHGHAVRWVPPTLAWTTHHPSRAVRAYSWVSAARWTTITGSVLRHHLQLPRFNTPAPRAILVIQMHSRVRLSVNGRWLMNSTVSRAFGHDSSALPGACSSVTRRCTDQDRSHRDAHDAVTFVTGTAVAVEPATGFTFDTAMACRA